MGKHCEIAKELKVIVLVMWSREVANGNVHARDDIVPQENGGIEDAQVLAAVALVPTPCMAQAHAGLRLSQPMQETCRVALRPVDLVSSIGIGPHAKGLHGGLCPSSTSIVSRKLRRRLCSPSLWVKVHATKVFD